MVLCGKTWWRQANGRPMLIVGSSLAGSYNSCGIYSWGRSCGHSWGHSCGHSCGHRHLTSGSLLSGVVEGCMNR